MMERHIVRHTIKAFRDIGEEVLRRHYHQIHFVHPSTATKARIWAGIHTQSQALRIVVSV